MKTIRDINKLLKNYQFYIQLPFWDTWKIKKVEFDSEDKRFKNWVKDYWAFYLIYDCNWVENVNEWILYWVKKSKWIEKIYDSFDAIKNIWCNTIVSPFEY